MTLSALRDKIIVIFREKKYNFSTRILPIRWAVEVIFHNHPLKVESYVIIDPVKNLNNAINRLEEAVETYPKVKKLFQNKRLELSDSALPLDLLTRRIQAFRIPLAEIKINKRTIKLFTHRDITTYQVGDSLWIRKGRTILKIKKGFLSYNHPDDLSILII